MMDRRRFLGALGVLAVAGKAAPDILAKLQPAAPLAFDEMSLGMSDILVSANGYGLSGSTWGQWQGEQIAVISPASGHVSGYGTVTAVGDGCLTIEWSRA